mgnify:CR=1 FL=1
MALPIGLICLSFSIFQDRFLPETGLFGFMQGFLFGMGVVLTYFYIFTSMKSKKNEQDN